jgi:hypothetical protein
MSSILKSFLTDPSAPLAGITQDSDLNVSEDIVRQALRERDYYAHIALKKLFLTKRKKSIRYTWCKMRQKWGVKR